MRNTSDIIGDAEDERGKQIYQLLVSGLPHYRHIQHPTKLNATRLAEDLGITRQAVNNWFIRGKLSPTKILALTKLPTSKLTLEKLVPYTLNADD